MGEPVTCERNRIKNRWNFQESSQEAWDLKQSLCQGWYQKISLIVELRNTFYDHSRIHSQMVPSENKLAKQIHQVNWWNGDQ